MSWLVGDYVATAYQSLRRSRTRTLLTTLGIAIGVASVTTILALSGGLADVITKQLDRLGGNVIIVRPGASAPQAASLPGVDDVQQFATSTLTEADVDAVKGLDGVDATAPLMILRTALRTTSKSLSNTVVIATTGDFKDVAKVDVRDGAFIDAASSDHAIVLGRQLAVDLFGTEQPIGLTLTLKNERFTVVGILRPVMDPVNYNKVDLDSAAFVSFSVGKALNRGGAQVQQIDIRAKHVDSLAQVARDVQAALLKNHANEQDFSVVSGQDIGNATRDAMRSAVSVLVAIAAISLVVGGIGVMNIMLVGVAERTREIGIRKAVGATSASIAGQFMIESAMMSLFGGFLGYLLGYTVAFGLSTQLYFVPSVNWQVALIAFTMSLGVGVVFGFYPALRAARKRPIESLRQYH